MHGLDRDGAPRRDNPLDDRPVRLALAMLYREIDRPGESRAADFDSLWSLERVAVLYGRIPDVRSTVWATVPAARSCCPARRRWRKRRKRTGTAGAVRSCCRGSTRTAPGHQEATPAPCWFVDTSFALLFLKQANLAQDLTAKLRLLSEKK